MKTQSKARQILDEAITEVDFLKQLIDLAAYTGWRSFHVRPARTKDSWRTPVQGDGKGWPDLVLLKQGQMIIAELKSETGKLTPEEDEWLHAFLLLPQAKVHLWRPSMIDDIEATLTGGKPSWGRTNI